MRRILIGTLAAVFVVGTALIAAQDPADQQKAQPSVSQQEKEKAVTYTGCLEAGATPGTFVLSNATEAKSDTPAPPTGANPPSPVTNPDATAADAKGQSLMLQGTPVGFDLATNLNHKIQVTGSIAEIPAAARTEPRAERSAPTMKSFTVRSAKSLADRCTSGQ